MDSCHLFNFLFGTRKATSELRKCFTSGPHRDRPTSSKRSNDQRGKDNNIWPKSEGGSNQHKQEHSATFKTKNSLSPLKQIQQKLISFSSGGSESSLSSAPLERPTPKPRQFLEDRKRASTANSSAVDDGEAVEHVGLACGIFEAQLVRLDGAIESCDLSQSTDENNNQTRAPLKVIVENPANSLDKFPELDRELRSDVSQQRINVYDNPLIDQNDESLPENEEQAKSLPIREQDKDDEQSRANGIDKNEKSVRSLVQSFEISRRQSSVESSYVTAGRRPSKPPDTPPKSTRAKCLNLQLSLRRPTSIAALFQDEAFLARHFFNNLEPIDRCAAAQVCRRWRNILYADKKYWKDLVGVIDCTQLRREHLADCILNTLQTARLKHQQHNHQRTLNNQHHHHHHPEPHHQHHLHQATSTSQDLRNDLGQLDEDEIWRIQELCNRYTMRSFASSGLANGTIPNGQPNQSLSNRTSSASQNDQQDAVTATTQHTTSTSGIANSKSSSSQISSSTLSSISISSLLSPLSESSRVDSIRERLYTALDERGFDSICLFGATDDDIDDLASKTRPNGAQIQIKLGRLSNCSISDRGLEMFVATFGQIVELELTGCNEITNAIDLRGLRRLRRLIITDCINIADGLAQRLVDIFHQLEVLVVQAYHLTDAFLEFVSLNSDTSRLKRLELPNCKEITNASAVTIAKHFPAVESLSISGSTKINDDGVEILADMKCVTSLDLGWLKIGDMALECLACDLRHLRELILDRNAHITDMGLGYLATMANLSLLYVRWCPQLTDKSIKSISTMRTLTHLSLAGLHQITARGILSLIDSQQLRELELTNCPAVTCELAQFLSAKMPNCSIIY